MDLNTLYDKFNEYKNKKLIAEQDLKSDNETVVKVAQFEYDMASDMMKQLGAIIIEITSTNNVVQTMQQLAVNKEQVEHEKETIVAQLDKKIYDIDTQISVYSSQSREAEIYLAVKNSI